MPNPPVKVRGLAELNRVMSKLSKEDATKAGQSAIRSGAGGLAKVLRQRAPNSPRTTEGETRNRHNKGGTTRTETHGKIVNNLKVKKTRPTSPSQVQTSVYVGPKAYHASYVEFGSIHNTANPWMLETLKAHEGSLIDRIAVTLNKQLIKHGV